MQKKDTGYKQCQYSQNVITALSTCNMDKP